MKKQIKIGILGGGQLARMSTIPAKQLGFDVVIMDKEKNSPAAQLTNNEFVGWVDDEKILKSFTEYSDIITLENEFIDSSYLKKIEDWGKKVIPSSHTISLIQDKFVQKTTLKNAGLPVPLFIEVNNISSFDDIKNNLSLPFILKSRKMGYDGYGNYLVKNEEDFKKGLEKLSSRHSELMAEEFIPFLDELAIMVVKTTKEIMSYPVVTTIQKNHICHIVIAEQEYDTKISEMVKTAAIDAVKAVDGFGIFGIEFFLTKEKNILINEMAPRPHNSGHFTIDACLTSQFENHIRAVLDLPLGSPDLIEPIAVMVNILGKNNGDPIPDNYEEILKDSNVHLHLYGKKISRVGRKMGHVTVIGKDKALVLGKAIAAESKINL